MLIKIAWRCHRYPSEFSTQSDCNEIFRNGSAKADPGIKSFLDDIYHPVINADFELHFRIFADKAWKMSRHNEASTITQHIKPELSHGTIAHAVNFLKRVANFFKSCF